MELSNKQILLIDSMKSIIETWRITNDIKSPTHIGDIREFLNADLMDVVSDEDVEEIEDHLIGLLSIARKYGKRILDSEG